MTISPETMIPDLLQARPAARAVFDRYGLSGCGGQHGPVESIGFFAKTHGVDEGTLLAELTAAAAAKDQSIPHADPCLSDTIYRRYFLGGITIILTAGAVWGAWLLWQIGFAGKFTGVSLQDVNAHGHAQIYGWVGLFIMGFAYQAFPRMWHVRLAAPWLAAAAFILMAVGIIVRTGGMTIDALGEHGVFAATVGGLAEVLATVLFAGQLLASFRRSKQKFEPYLAFAFAAVGWFVMQGVMDVWYTRATMTAPSREILLGYVSTYQAPLRDLQIHGLALFMVLGVSIRMLPALFDLRPTPVRTAWWSFVLLTAAVISEVVLFVAYRKTGSHLLAGLLMVPWAMLAVGCALVAWPWRLWRPLPIVDRSGKFIRAAYAWLAVSLAMLLLLPVYQQISGIPFSHAYYGAIRHAITVGFISLMIMGMAAKVVATLNGEDTRRLTDLWGPFLLVNTGCFLRVSLQTLTDWHPKFFAVVGVSGVLEVIGLAWWGAHLAGIIRRGRRATAADAEERKSAARPDYIGSMMKVTDVLDWFPQTGDVFDRHGFLLLRNPIARRTVARNVTLSQAARVGGVDIHLLVSDLAAAAGVAAKMDCSAEPCATTCESASRNP